MASNGTSRRSSSPLRPCVIPELAHLVIQAPGSAPLRERSSVEASYNSSKYGNNSPPQRRLLNHQATLIEGGCSIYGSFESPLNNTARSVEDRHGSNDSPSRDVATDILFPWEHKGAIPMRRQRSCHGDFSRLERHNTIEDDFEQRSSLDSHIRTQTQNRAYLPSPDNFSAYPLYLRRQVIGNGRSTPFQSTNEEEMGDGDIELDPLPLHPTPVPARKGLRTPYPLDLIPQRKRPYGAQDPASRFPKSGFIVTNRAAGSILNCNPFCDGTVQNVPSKPRDVATNNKGKSKAPIKSCIKQSSGNNLTSYPSAEEARDIQDTVISSNQIQSEPQTRAFLPAPSHTPAQYWSDNTSAHVVAAGARAYDSNTPLNIAKQRYASVEQALCNEIRNSKGCNRTSSLLSAPQYHVLNTHTAEPSDGNSTFRGEDLVSYVKFPTCTHVNQAELDEIRPTSLFSEPELFTAIEASIFPIGPKSVRMRSIRRTKGMRTLNCSETGPQQQSSQTDSDLSMGLEGQELSKTQILTTGQSVEATSQLASVHSYEQQELVHRYRRQTVDQWAGILCPSPVSPQPMEPEGLCRSSDQNGTYPDIASGSPSTIPGRKDGSPYSAKFTERMELDGPATRSSPSPDTANIMDREYEGEVYPENPETPNQSLDDEFTDNEVPTADNSASEEDSASSKKTGEVTPEASSAIARFNGAGEKGGVGKDSRFKGKVRSVVARVKRALRWTACAKKKTCGKLRCKVKRLRGCDAPHA